MEYILEGKRFLFDGKNRFEIIDWIPMGYDIWNIGENMADGYLPLCRLKMIQPFDGAREVETDTLKAIRIEDIPMIMSKELQRNESYALYILKMFADKPYHNSMEPGRWDYRPVSLIREFFNREMDAMVRWFEERRNRDC